MPEPAFDAYAEAFDSRCASSEGPGTQRVERSGIRGLLAVDDASRTQLLVLDDRAVDVLPEVLPPASRGTVRVHEAARRCAELVRQDPSWVPKDVTAMVCAELRSVPEPPLPGGLSLRPVRRVPDEPADGVPLAAAVAAVDRTGPEEAGRDRALVAYLSSLSHGCPRLLAAVDDAGAVCGTSGSQVFGADAYVFFVNTVPAWRRRGVGLATTAAALHVARAAGAARACLDASGAGVPLYRRLGFTVAGRLTQFSRSG